MQSTETNKVGGKEIMCNLNKKKSTVIKNEGIAELRMPAGKTIGDYIIGELAKFDDFRAEICFPCVRKLKGARIHAPWIDEDVYITVPTRTGERGERELWLDGRWIPARCHVDLEYEENCGACISIFNHDVRRFVRDHAPYKNKNLFYAAVAFVPFSVLMEMSSYLGKDSSLMSEKELSTAAKNFLTTYARHHDSL